MSASKKLKALKRVANEDEENPLRSIDAEREILDALRQIIAVVEAAEKHIDMEWEAFIEYGQPEEGDLPPNTTNAKLADALAALAETLP